MLDPLDRLRAHPDRSAILTDFDGTLSPIVEDWNAAAPLPAVCATPRLAPSAHVTAIRTVAPPLVKSGMIAKQFG